MNYINGSELANKRFIQLENGDYREVLKGKFIPNDGEQYYFLNIGGSVRATYNDSSADKWTIKHNLVFRTYEECEDYKKFLELLDEYSFKPNWDDLAQAKWLPCFVHSGRDIYFTIVYVEQYAGVFFESEEKGRAFVEKVGKEAVKRYMFDVWE